MQINVGSFLDETLSAEQRIGAEILKAYGLSGTGFDNLSLMDIFGAPGHSAIGTSALRDVEQLRGWNFTATLAKALQFGLGSMAVMCPMWLAEAIAIQKGEEYKASKRVTGTEQYGVPEDWVIAPQQHRIAKLMRSPNPWTDESMFLFQIAEQTGIHGVAQILVLPNVSGFPQELWVIPKAAIQPMAPSASYPEGSYRIGHLSKLSINTYSNDDPVSLQQALARISFREYSAKYIISVGLPSPVFADDFLNPSSALSDTLDTDRQLHASRRNMLEKLMTGGPRMEPLPGVTITNEEWIKLMEEFESQNTGSQNQGKPWRTPSGVKVSLEGHSGREMEFVRSVDQSRDHTLGQHLMSSSMLGLGDGGSYAQVVGLIKGNARLVMQPLMRIYSGQLTIGLRRFFEPPQTEFITILQVANIDDPEQRLREWKLLKECGAVKKSEVRSAFNMMPFGDEKDEEIAGAPSPLGGFGPEEYLPEEEIAFAETGQTDSGAPESPGIGLPETPGAANADLTTSALSTPVSTARSIVGTTMSRREFMRHSKNILDIVTKFKDGLLGERTARLMLETLGLPADMSQEFIESAKDRGDDQSMSTSEDQATASALFARMAVLKPGAFTGKSIIDDQAQTAATNPGNALKMPSEADLKAGTYRKGKVRLCGLMIEIENPVGSVRSGRRPDGTRWAIEMKDHYGYVVGTVGYDKDQLDIFIKRGTEPTFDGMVYVINQANADGTFDEHKCFIGCESRQEAIKRYLENYDDDWSDRIMSVAQLTIPEFKVWLLDAAGGPIAGELTPELSAQYGESESVNGPADPIFARAMMVKVRKAPESIRDGDGDRLIHDGTPQEQPVGQRQPESRRRGRRPRNTPEQIAAIHDQIRVALKGERDPKTATALADQLSNLTVRQLHELKRNYNMKASGRVKDELVAKIARRLDAGRRLDHSLNPMRPSAPQQPASHQKKPSPEPEAQHADAARARVNRLKENLPAKFIIASDENGRQILVSPNDRARRLSDNPAKQVQQIESRLRRFGFDPDQVAQGNTKPKDTPADPKPQKSAAAIEPAGPPAQEAAVPVVARRPRLTASQRSQLKAIGADFLDNISPTPEGSLCMAQPESKARVLFTEGEVPRTWDEVPTQLQQEVKNLHRDETRNEIRNNSFWKENVRNRAREEAIRLIDETMPGATPEERSAAVVSKMGQLMHGRSSWFKERLKNEVDAKVAAMNNDRYYQYAQRKNMLESLSAPHTEAALRSFGMKKQDLASILGIPDDWTVSAKGKLSADGSYAIGLEVRHPLARLNRTLYMNNGKPVLYNSSFFADSNAPKGLGLDIFSKSVANAKRLGISYIHTMPCRSSGPNGMVGYAVWPQFGYDAPLSFIADANVRQQVTMLFPQARTIRDIYDTPGGQQWWWEYGTSISGAQFSLEDNSRNIRALDAYMSKKKTARDRVRSSGTGAA